MGISFTPNTNITVTHVRHIHGTKVSIWTDSGVFVASQNVLSTPGVWVETPLAVPVQLTAGVKYRLGAYTAGATWYYRSSPPTTFASGLVQGGIYSSGDNFPTSVDTGNAYLVDLRYTIGSTLVVPFTPAVTAGFTNGVWGGNLTVQAPATNLVFVARDNDGHSGQANSIDVTLLNDLSIAMSVSPAVGHSGQTSRSCAQLHQLSSTESAFAPRSTSGR